MALTQISSEGIKDAQVKTADILDANITTAKIANDAITSALVADDAITSAAIADDAITSALIADDAVGSAAIADDAITSALIADDAVTTAAIADDAITSALIADDAITSALIADDAITSALIADDAINEARLQISNAGSNGQVLTKQSGNTGGLTWADAATAVAGGTGIDLNDGVAARWGTGNDLIIQHNGTDSYIDNNEGDLYLQTTGSGDDIIIQSADDAVIAVASSATAVEAIGGGAVNLYHDNSNKFQTTATGVNVTGQLVTDGASHAGDVIFQGDGANAYWDKSEDDLIFNDGAGAYFGTSQDGLKIYHDGSTSFIDDTGTGILRVRGNEIRLCNTSNETYFTGTENAAAKLYYNDVVKFETTANGVTISTSALISGANGTGYSLTIEPGTAATPYGVWIKEPSSAGNGYPLFNITDSSGAGIFRVDSGTGDLTIPSDSKKLKFGVGSDLQIYHDGSHSYLANTTGNLYITEDGYIELSSANGGEKYATFNKDGAVDLYHNNLKKIETTSYGADVLSVTDAKLRINNSGDGTATLTLGNTGSTNFQFDNTNAVLSIGPTGETSIKATSNGSVELYYNNVKKFETLSSGSKVTGALTVTGNIHAEGHVQLSDNDTIKVGTGDDLEIYHDGTHSYLKNSTNNLKVLTSSIVFKNAADDEILAQFTQNGSCDLYYDNIKQCETSDVGLKFPAGKGIDFSATSDATGMSSELLDDYEEGSWTPTFIGAASNPTITYDAQEGAYTRIGRVVMFECRVRTDSVSGGAATALYIDGLPFTSVNSNTGDAGGAITFSDLWTEGTHPFSAFINKNWTKIGLYKNNGSGDSETLKTEDLATSNNKNDIRIAGHYITAT